MNESRGWRVTGESRVKPKKPWKNCAMSARDDTIRIVQIANKVARSAPTLARASYLKRDPTHAYFAGVLKLISRVVLGQKLRDSRRSRDDPSPSVIFQVMAVLPVANIFALRNETEWGCLFKVRPFVPGKRVAAFYLVRVPRS